MSKLQKTDAVLNIITFAKINWPTIISGGGAMSFSLFDGFPATYVFLFCSIGILIGLMVRNALRSKQPQTIQEKIEEQKPMKLEEVVNKTFTSQTVRLDGKVFILCKFHSCTLEYNGGDFGFDQSDIRNDCRINFLSKAANAGAWLIHTFSFLTKASPTAKLQFIDQHGSFLLTQK